jgi:hypothetical protein
MRSLKPYLWAISKILNWVFTRIVALIFGIFPVNSLLFLYGSDNSWDFLHHFLAIGSDMNQKKVGNLSILSLAIW